eukprot:GHVH01004416.1.p1 GENE.GHVH01004416.1~~GHVH01004416.1.p1  ORF type:complete len:897 (-),score=160.62 GHVH01004416.1:41-2731(-)
MQGKTVIASCTLDLRALIVAEKARTWNGYLPLDTLGGSSGGSLAPMINAAVTLSKKVLSHPMVSSPMPCVELNDDDVKSKVVKSRVGRMKLIVKPKSDESRCDAWDKDSKHKKLDAKYMRKLQYQSLAVVLHSLHNIVDAHGGDPVSGVQVVLGKSKVDLPARLAGAHVNANARFTLPYSGNRYLRVVLKDRNGDHVASHVLDLQSLLFDHDTGVAEKQVALVATSPEHPLYKCPASARLSVMLNPARCHSPEVEMSPQPTILVTPPEPKASKIIEEVKESIIKGTKAPRETPDGFSAQASMLMSVFQAPKVHVSDDDSDEVEIELERSFYNGVAQEEGFGFLNVLNDLSHANDRLGAQVDLESELAQAIELEDTHKTRRSPSSSYSSTSSSTSSNKSTKSHRSAKALLYTAMDKLGIHENKTVTGASIAQVKQTANGLVSMESDDDDELVFATMNTSHAFHSFQLTAETLSGLVLPKGVDKVWVEAKYAAHSCPSFHYNNNNGNRSPISVRHCFEYPIDSVACKYMHVTLLGSQSTSKSLTKRCIKLGQAVLDIESFVLQGSTDFERDVDFYCFPDHSGGIDIRATMYNKPTREMTKVGSLRFCLHLRNKQVLGPMAYPSTQSVPQTMVTTTVANKQIEDIQKASFKPPPMNAALLAGIRGARKDETPSKQSEPAPPSSVPIPSPTKKDKIMRELSLKVEARKEKMQADEQVFQSQLLTTDVIRQSEVDSTLIFTKMETPNTCMIEAHSLTIFQTSLLKPDDLCYLKFCYPDFSILANVKSKTPPSAVDKLGHVDLNLSKCKFPMPYNLADNSIMVQAWRSQSPLDKGELIAEYELMNVRDTWSKTFDKAILKRRLQLRNKKKLVGEAVCSFVFSNDPAIETKDFHTTSVSHAMF